MILELHGRFIGLIEIVQLFFQGGFGDFHSFPEGVTILQYLQRFRVLPQVVVVLSHLSRDFNAETALQMVTAAVTQRPTRAIQ